MANGAEPPFPVRPVGRGSRSWERFLVSVVGQVVPKASSVFFGCSVFGSIHGFVLFVNCLLFFGWFVVGVCWLLVGWVWYSFWGGQVGGEVPNLGTRVVPILGRSIREP